METPFEVRNGDKGYLIVREKGILSKVCVIFYGQDISAAPEFSSSGSGESVPQLSLKDSYSLLAERDIRSWQSILAPYKFLEIDFTVKETSYHPETVEEQEAIKVKSFSIGTTDERGLPPDDFSIFGRSFLAIPRHYDHIARSAFYLEGWRHLRTNHFIDAFNQFYLYLEANFNLPFKTAAATKSLMGEADFQKALKLQAKNVVAQNVAGKLTLEGCSGPDYDAEKLTKSIIALRGHLRHNTLSNPNRWDPHNHDKHRHDAVFLAGICQTLAYPTFAATFDSEYAQQFLQLAEKKKHMKNIRVMFSFKDLSTGMPRDFELGLSFPTLDDTPNLAKVALSECLKIFDQKFPGAELYGIRATLDKTGMELFRYDLGPSIGRE